MWKEWHQQVLFNSNKVKVAFDEDAVSAESLAQTITDLGYPVVSFKAALPAQHSTLAARK